VARLGSDGWRWSSIDIAREDLTDAGRQGLARQRFNSVAQAKISFHEMERTRYERVSRH
jgi:hypothetical protein